MIILGDMNQHLVARCFEELLTVYGLKNHVNFPTHISGSSLDPVVTDFPENLVCCRSLGTVGSSDHHVIRTNINIATARDEAVTRTIWLWDKGDWKGFRDELIDTDWSSIFIGNVDEQTVAFTNLILYLQKKYIPYKTYVVKPQDQPWFGYRCRVAADAKSKAWARLRNNPTRRNKNLHVKACREMNDVQKWAIKRWRDDIKQKLTGRSVGSKEWWNLVKQQQGFLPDDSIPPLNKTDGSVAIGSEEKAEMFASYFASKMSVPDPDRLPPLAAKQTNKQLASIEVTVKDVEQYLLHIDTKKAHGPDNISPNVLRKCAYQLSIPLASLFRTCLLQKQWPYLWKCARMVAVHKKKCRTAVENYRPISLLSLLGKIFEKIIVKKMTNYFEENYLLSNKQFGFRQNRSTSDLLLQLSTSWNKSLDNRRFTYVIALDIAGAFDRVWHAGIITKLESMGIHGNLLMMLQSYLKDRRFHVVVNGHSSKEYPVGASVPQGSVIGPLLWNVYFNDILHLIPEACAYADDCTLTFTCDNDDHRGTISYINETLSLIVSWGKRWQVTLAPDKTQVMLISRRQEPSGANLTLIKLEGKALPMQSTMNILGVNFDCNLSFTSHVKEVASKSARKLACIRRISHLLDNEGCRTLYNSQVRSLMEYSPLVWSSSPPTYLRLLDKVHERARRLIEYKSQTPSNTIVFQTLQHRRDVSGLCVFFKIHRRRDAHLTSLRLPVATSIYDTRGAHRTGHELHIPFARTEQYMRSFHPRYARLWNLLVRNIGMSQINAMQNFKNVGHAWGTANSNIM